VQDERAYGYKSKHIDRHDTKSIVSAKG
jgi:hypothetical protein